MSFNAVPPASLVSSLRTARRIVVLSGAGMSAESGIPTFRDQGSGLWSRFDPQELATPGAFRRDPETVWAWYEWRRRSACHAVPHAGHFALTALAARPEVEALTVVTQNVDDLHERAGTKAVLHLHGSLFAPRCFDCGRAYGGLADSSGQELDSAAIRLTPPRCATCHGLIRPGVVWFGEGLPEAVWLEARRTIERADLVLVVGTSGLVYPAADLPDAARRKGCAVSVINPDASSTSSRGSMDWQIQAGVGLPALVSKLDT
ncbi:NAD-dependent deacylase [Variovorax sp. J22R115]|uniref:SIR2 family NAD-dependent protein deacylase n=1 Tax=Variovorax sp. J22R115 TaxID=3053509 RepID=UPI002578FD21|nr:NAD-dependent deacylase [Variovorax sp. J22R115]MDM0053790.1 NAD-dependent deacylase [Variovorax sp. J22R115]